MACPLLFLLGSILNLSLSKQSLKGFYCRTTERHKLLSSHIVMKKILSLILPFVLAMLLLGGVSDAFTTRVADAGDVVSQSLVADGVTLASQSSVVGEGGVHGGNAVASCKGHYIMSPQSLRFSDVEIANSGGTTQLLASQRLQRSYISEFTLSLKGMARHLSRRADALSVQSSRLFDTSAFYRCQPVCEYYVFTLRHIII